MFVVGAAAAGLLVAAAAFKPAHHRPAVASAPTPTVSTPSTTAAVPTVTEPPTRSTSAPAIHSARFTVSAARGSSWVSIRAGSSTGRVLYAGILQQPRAVSFVQRKVYLGFGAAANLDVSVGGRKVTGLPSGTSAVLMTWTGRWSKTAYVG